MQTKQCGHCGRKLGRGRADRKFCDANCRAAYHRGQQHEQEPGAEADVRKVRTAVRRGTVSDDFAEAIDSDKEAREDCKGAIFCITEALANVAIAGNLTARGKHYLAAETISLARLQRRIAKMHLRYALEALERADDETLDGISPEAEAGLDELTNVLGMARADDGDDDENDGREAL